MLSVTAFFNLFQNKAIILSFCMKLTSTIKLKSISVEKFLHVCCSK